MSPLKFGDKKLMGFIRIKLPHKPVRNILPLPHSPVCHPAQQARRCFMPLKLSYITSLSVPDGKEHSVLPLSTRIYL